MECCQSLAALFLVQSNPSSPFTKELHALIYLPKSSFIMKRAVCLHGEIMICVYNVIVIAINGSTLKRNKKLRVKVMCSKLMILE